VAFVTLLGTGNRRIIWPGHPAAGFYKLSISGCSFFVILMLNLSVALVSNVMGTTLVATGIQQKPMIINV